MKVRMAVVVVVVLTSFALAVPASASVRDHVAAKPAKRHPYGWMKLAPVDQMELDASRYAGRGSEQLVVPAAPDQPARSVQRGAGLWAIKEKPPHPPADGMPG